MRRQSLAIVPQVAYRVEQISCQQLGLAAFDGNGFTEVGGVLEHVVVVALMLRVGTADHPNTPHHPQRRRRPMPLRRYAPSAFRIGGKLCRC
jgi:hypothetical protein